MSKRKRKSGDKRRRHHISSRRGRRLAGAGLTIGATLAAGGTAQAADFTVTSLADTAGTCDPSGCTLRTAIDAANLNPADSDRILFSSSLSGTIALSAPLPPITGPVSISGPGPVELAVSGGGAFPIFHFDAPSHFNASIEELTLRDGSTPGNGGAIDNDGAHLSVRGSVITGNHAGGTGGGIHSDYYLLLAGSVVSNNTAGGAGGGIEANSQINPDNQLALTHSTISQNHAGGSGGGIDISGSGGNINDSTFSSNDADLGGGAIEDNSSQLFAGYSTFDHNHADGSGGAVEAGASGLFGTHQATLSYNSAGASGGAVDAAGDLGLRQTTIANNSAVTSGGGVHSSGSGTPGLYNTIVASDSAATGPDLAGAFDARFSLVEATAGATINTTVTGSNIFGLDPQLGPLANNGGLTLTRALPLTSPAVDKGTGGTVYTNDQRGMPRSIDLPTIVNSTAAGADASDIGAFELQQGPAAPGGTTGSPPTGSPGSGDRPECEGKKATIFPRGKHHRLLSGTSGRDVIVGTDRDESIGGGGGNDIICAGGGDDTVKGGAGNDQLFGQGGKDELSGDAGKDQLNGGGGQDSCVGGSGKDTTKSC